MNHENPYTLTMQTTAAHAWDEGFEAGRIAERGRLAGEVTDVIDHLAAEAGSKRARTSQLHRIVTLDVAIEAVREGAAAASAAAQEREGTARLVADHWRKAMLDAGDERMPARAAAHPLCMVLAALDGETRPEHLGITPESDEWHVLSAALADPGAAR